MSATSPTISTAPPPLTTRIARSTPCVCGYDLQGLAADGRCPECARKIDGMLVASRLMPAVAQWRRRVAFAGGVIAVSGGLWVLAASFVLVASGSPEQIFFALLGPHVCSTALVARELAGSARASIVVITAMLGAACFGMGLWMLTRTPRELPRSRARMALAGLLRLSIIFALAITVNVVPAELVRGPTFISSFFWTASYQWTGVADAAELIVAGMYLNDLYSDLLVKSHLLLVQQLCMILGGTFLIQGAVSYVDRSLRMPLHVLAPGSAMAVVAVYSWRILFSRWTERVAGARLLLVGGNSVLAEIEAYIHEHPERGVRIIGCISDEIVDSPGRAKFLGRLDALREVVNATRPSRIVVGMQERRSRLPVAELLDLRFNGNIIEEAATAYERICGRVCTKELRPSQLIYSGEFGPRRNQARQNITNFITATIGLIVASPLMILTALAVKLTSAGPILYRQQRVGMDGVPFNVFKFRSMRVDAEAATGAVWAQKNDPRVTPVGRIIRKLRFDELPQLVNVLRGEMSIVGPRPERPEFVKILSDQIPYYRQRHAVRPGITGWAQINHKYGDTLEDTITKLEYDLYYIKNMSWSLDSYIIFHTVKAMLLSRGAQ